MELRDYLNVISARRWVIIQAVVIVTLTALVVSILQPKTYEGTALVLISEKGSSASVFGDLLPQLSTQPERAMQTQVQLMQIRPIAEATIKELNLQTTPDAFLDSVKVGAIGQTNLVKITVTNANPEQAARIANTVAEEYVDSARSAQRASLAEAAVEVQKRLDEAEADILDLGDRVSKSGKSDQLSAELQIATGTYTTLAEKLEQLRINERLESGPGRVVSAAAVSENAVSPKPLRNVGLGLVVGFLFGLGMAFLYEYLDNTIKSSDEAERIFGAPVLGTIPLDVMAKGQKRRLTIVEAPGSATAESYRVLRNSLDFINFQHDMKTILVTSAAPGEGKSTVASNLAAALAQTGKKVVLVSVDFRRPTTEQFFGVNNIIGLSDVLIGTHTLKAALQQPGSEQLLVMTAGKMPPNPSELLGSTKMQEVVKLLEEWSDWVIIDTPPLLAVADAAAVARWSDGVLMVTQAAESTREAGKRALELLGKVGAKITGVVVWGLDESKSGSGGYGYSSGYYYASYYATPLGTGRRGTKHDNGAKAVGADEGSASQQWVPVESAGRRFARGLGQVLTGVLSFLLILAITAVVAYFLDQYFGWGLIGQVGQIWN
ncbi:MAG: polysaccharide biosynthesis tyrosine autokinase [Actinobacteria bacterium]|nr:polysaccharide biosynthesis tyrosine autokinase [Actinomycetota bacterium]MCG2807498.1 polysaccharide biosynthesis tyrosine autokinase [Coriobacteriia bacterium]